jgi:hypothetical protein
LNLKHGLNSVYLVQCLFLLYSLFLCVAYAAEVSFDKKGLLEAVQSVYFLLIIVYFFTDYHFFIDYLLFFINYLLLFIGYRSFLIDYLLLFFNYYIFCNVLNKVTVVVPCAQSFFFSEEITPTIYADNGNLQLTTENFETLEQ